MQSVATYIGLTIGLAGLVVLAVYYIQHYVADKVAVQVDEAALQQERARVAAMDRAAAAERAARAQEFDAKVAGVHDAAGAAGLLRQVTGADDPKTN